MTSRSTMRLPDITSKDTALQNQVLGLAEEKPGAKTDVFEDVSEQAPAYRGVRTSRAQAAKEAKPKRKPIRHKSLLVMGIVIVLLVAGLGVLYWLTMGSSHSQAKKELDEAISLIEKADEVVIKVDAAIDQTVTEDTLPELETLIEQIPDAKDTLLEATSLAQKAQDKIGNGDDREFVQHVIDSAAARSEMLNSGTGLLEADRDAMVAASALSKAFSKGVEADAKMREAVETVTSISAASESKELNTEARDLFQEATDLAKQAQEAFPEADLSVIIEYFQTRLDTANIAIESDQAVLNENASDVKSLNKDYEEKDEKAVELAKQIPSDPLSIIYSLYEERVASLREAYLEARSRASEADVFIRQYREVAETVSGSVETDAAATKDDETDNETTTDSGEGEGSSQDVA